MFTWKDFIKMLSDYKLPQAKSWAELLRDTNDLMRWDKIFLTECEVAYNDACIYLKKQNFRKAAESFYKSGKLAEDQHRRLDLYWTLMYYSAECYLWDGQFEPLVYYAQSVIKFYQVTDLPRDWPSSLNETLGMIGLAHCGYAGVKRADNEARVQALDLALAYFALYFKRTGNFKDFEYDFIHYVFYGKCIRERVGNKEFITYAHWLKESVPKEYAIGVFERWGCKEWYEKV